LAIRLSIPKSFKKSLDKKEPLLRASILDCLHTLSDNPRHPSLQTHKVRGTPGVFEAYVDKANRVTFQYGNDCIVLRNHCNHDIIKRSP